MQSRGISFISCYNELFHVDGTKGLFRVCRRVFHFGSDKSGESIFLNLAIICMLARRVDLAYARLGSSFVDDSV